MKANKISIFLLGLFTVGALVVTNMKDSFSMAYAKSSIQGYYAKASSGSNLEHIKFDLEDNSAPIGEYKALTSDAIRLIKETGEEFNIPESYVGVSIVLSKLSGTTYEINKSIFDYTGSGVLAGDTLILDGDFKCGGEYLNIKESKLYVYTKDAVVTVPHKVNNVSKYFEYVRSSKEALNRDWYFLIYVEQLPYEAMLRTKDNGYYPTSIHSIYVNGEPHANCLYDAVRRRDEGGLYCSNEIFICASSQIGIDNPAVGTVVVLDGVFSYKNYIAGQYPENPILDLEPGESFGIQIDLLALLKVGGHVDDYVQINLKEYLVQQFDLLFDPDLYDPDLYIEINEIRNDLVNNIEDLSTAKEIYALYNACVRRMSALELSEDQFQSFKDKYIEEVSNHVDISNYLGEDVITIQGYIDSCIETINSATTTKEIVDAVNFAESNIDTINTRLYKMEQAILNKESGWEQYLQPYDYVTLDDLSLGESQTFHGRKNQRGDDINSNAANDNQFNTFVPSENNKSGNVVFSFEYQGDAIPTGEANVIVVLRGVSYYGYKFGFGTNTKGFYFKRTYGSGDDSFAGKENSFPSSTSRYRVSIYAIDLIEGNRTWIRVVIGGFEYINKIVDSLSFADNPRVALSNNDFVGSDVDGTATIYNYYHSKSESIKPTYYGMFSYDSNYNDNDKVLHLSLAENDLAYDASNGVNAYALRNTQIKLIRNNVEHNLSKTDNPAIAKFTPTSYQVSLTSFFNNEITEIKDEDKIVVSGIFTYFDEINTKKVAYEIGSSTFLYHQSTNSWEHLVSLQDVKADAVRKLSNFVEESNLEKYDESDRNTLVNIVNHAIESVNSASTFENVNVIYAQAVSDIANVMTSLQKYQYEVKELLYLYKRDEYNLYRQEQLDTIDEYKEEAYNNIDNASNKEEVDIFYAEALEKIDTVLTEEEMIVKELKEAKQQALNEIKDRYASLANSSLSDEKLEKLNAETLEAMEAVKAAETIEEVNQIVNAYLKTHPVSNNSSSGCGGDIATSSIIVSALSLGLLILLIIKKTKYKLMRRTNQ